jgi:NAD-dependent DNA ligase
MDITALIIMYGFPAFREFLSEVVDVVVFAAPIDTSNGSMSEQKIVFTGFRDAVLKNEVEMAGGTMQSAASGKTTLVVAMDPNGTSGKLKKARDLGIEIISPDELRTRL